MTKAWFMILALGISAHAQGIYLGATGGAGLITASGPTLAAGQLGVEACIWCGGRFGFFGEYSHWFTSGATHGYNSSDAVQRADLVGGGLRIQGRVAFRPSSTWGLPPARTSTARAMAA